VSHCHVWQPVWCQHCVALSRVTACLMSALCHIVAFDSLSDVSIVSHCRVWQPVWCQHCVILSHVTVCLMSALCRIVTCDSRSDVSIVSYCHVWQPVVSIVSYCHVWQPVWCQHCVILSRVTACLMSALCHIVACDSLSDVSILSYCHVWQSVWCQHCVILSRVTVCLMSALCRIVTCDSRSDVSIVSYCHVWQSVWCQHCVVLSRVTACLMSALCHIVACDSRLMSALCRIVACDSLSDVSIVSYCHVWQPVWLCVKLCPWRGPQCRRSTVFLCQQTSVWQYEGKTCGLFWMQMLFYWEDVCGMCLQCFELTYTDHYQLSTEVLM